MAVSSSRSATLPSLAIAASGLLWGLWWIPFAAGGIDRAERRLVEHRHLALCSALTLPLALRARRPGGGDAGNLLIMGLMSGAALSAAERWADCDALIVRHQDVGLLPKSSRTKTGIHRHWFIIPGMYFTLLVGSQITDDDGSSVLRTPLNAASASGTKRTESFCTARG